MKLQKRLMIAPLVILVMQVISFVILLSIFGAYVSNSLATHEKSKNIISGISSTRLALSQQHADLYKTVTISGSLGDTELADLREKRSKNLQILAASVKEKVDASISIEGKKALILFMTQLQQYVQSSDSAIDLSTIDPNTGVAAMQTADAKFTELDQSLGLIANDFEKIASSESAAFEAVTQRQRLWVICLAMLLGAASLALAWVQQRDIVRDLAVCSQATHDVSAGKLDVKLHSERADELGDMMRSLGAMVHHLHSTIELVQQTAHTISAESQAIARDNNELKARTGEQVTSLEETVHAMRNITAAVTQNADNASTANQLAASASQIAVKGGVAMEQVVSTMNSIDESSRTIADIVGVIDTIAFQTNLLALNAAVEAARAGPQGKGFAVVATEVRHLAQRSAHAAKEIKALITKSVEKVGAGAVLVNQAGITMKEIVSSVNNVNQILADIATASQNQRAEIEAINQSVGHVDEATQKNRGLVDQTANAAVSLQKRANYLTQAIGTFQLEQRASRRVPLAVQGQLHIAHHATVPVQVVDISQTGVGITLKEELPQHQRVEMEFAMPVQGHNQRVMVQGRVVYCVANDAGHFKAGLEFVDMQAGFKENLNALTA